MEIRTYPFGPLDANLYLVTFGSDAMIIDPCVPYERIDIDALNVRGIFCTHAHYDHIAEAEELRRRTGAPILAYEGEAPAILNPELNPTAHHFPPLLIHPPIRMLREGDILYLREFAPNSPQDVSINVIHTPGHTEGSICLLFEEKTQAGIRRYLFSGDTLFAGSIGRTDLGGNMTDMRRSLARLSCLPDDVTVFPGHGGSTTMETEKRYNPYL